MTLITFESKYFVAEDGVSYLETLYADVWLIEVLRFFLSSLIFVGVVAFPFLHLSFYNRKQKREMHEWRKLY